MKNGLLNKIITIIIWMVAVALWASKGWWGVAAAIFGLHLAEVFLKGVKVGRMAGKTLADSVLLTLVFGIAWWKPLEEESKS